MNERRRRPRNSKHPLEAQARLKPKGPAIDRRKSPRKTTPTAKERLTVQLSVEILNRLRNAVFWTPGLTMTGLVELCVIDAVESMERKRGSTFPQRSDRLKVGRPLR